MNKKITVNLAVAIAIIAMTVTFVVTMILSLSLIHIYLRHGIGALRGKSFQCGNGVAGDHTGL